MKQFITTFIHMRNRVAKLELDLDHLTHIKDLVSESHMHDMKENERLTKENERLTKENEELKEENARLLNQMDSIVSVFETHASILKQCGIICEGHANTLKQRCEDFTPNKGAQQ